MSSLARRPLAALTLLCAAHVVTSARSAYASPSAKLVYVRGASAERCPGEPELRKAVAVRLGYDPFFPTANKTVIADVVRTDAGFRAKVRIIRDDGVVRGERELATTGADCGELVAALALAISIALDDLDERPPVTPAEPPTTELAVEPLPPATAAERPATVPAPASATPPLRPSLRVSLGPALSTGTAPAAAAGASLAAGVRLRRASLRVDGRAELPASEPFVIPTSPSSGRVTTSVFVATASACGHLSIAFGCAGGGIGRIATETRDLLRNASDAAPFAVLVARLGAEIELGTSFFLSPLLEVSVPLARHRVDVADATVFTMAPVAGTVALHVGARLF